MMSIIVTSHNLDLFEDVCDPVNSLRNKLKRNYKLVYVAKGDILLHRVILSKLHELGRVLKVMHYDAISSRSIRAN